MTVSILIFSEQKIQFIMHGGATLGHGKLSNGQQGQHFTNTFTRRIGSESC